MKNKNIVLLIIINILATITKILILTNFWIKAFIDHYSSDNIERYFIFFIGVIISILFDIVINYFSLKTINKKEKEKEYSFKKLIIIPLIITIVLTILYTI